MKQQECIPVGCVPAAHRPYSGVCFPAGGGLLPSPGGGVCLVWGGSPCWGDGGGGLPVQGVSLPGGACLVWGGFSLPRGSPSPGGSPCLGGSPCPGGVWLVQGGSPCWGGVGSPCPGGLPAWGGLPGLGGFSLPGGSPSLGGSPCPGGLPVRGAGRITDTCKNITLATTSLRPVKMTNTVCKSAFHETSFSYPRDLTFHDVFFKNGRRMDIKGSFTPTESEKKTDKNLRKFWLSLPNSLDVNES